MLAYDVSVVRTDYHFIPCHQEGTGSIAVSVDSAKMRSQPRIFELRFFVLLFILILILIHLIVVIVASVVPNTLANITGRRVSGFCAAAWSC